MGKMKDMRPVNVFLLGMQAGDVSYSIGYYLGSLGFLLLQKKGGEQAR